MRTKTILLSAAIGALSSAALMAQVYSVNTVGYINVTIPHGFSIVADQLYSGNNVITNLIAVDPAGSMDGDTIYKLVGGTHYAILSADSLNYLNTPPTPPWDGADSTTTTLNPGEAVFFYNANSQITLTFVGSVVQNPSGNTNSGPFLTNSLAHGFNLVSSIVPQGGDLSTNLNLTVDPGGAQDGDTVYTYNNATSHYSISSADSLNYLNTPPTAPWDGGSPSVVVGQGFFYYRAASTTWPWVRNFVVN